MAKNGKALSESKTLTFTTVKGPDLVTAYVLEPVNYSKVWINQTIQVVFTQAMDKESVETALKLIDTDNDPLPNELYSISWEDYDYRMVLTPKAACFNRDSKYIFKISNGEAEPKSIAGGLLKEEVSITFETTGMKGEGTEAKPYEVASVEDLKYIRDNFLGPDFSRVFFKQTCDINLSNYSEGAGWEPIGNLDNNFAGSYDGGGHKVTNLFINRVYTSCVGLFGYATGRISNLGVRIATKGVTGDMFVGGLVGYAFTGCDISNCYATGNVTGATNNVGGLVGESGGAISNSVALNQKIITTGSIYGRVVGSNYGTITNCYANSGMTNKNNERILELVGSTCDKHGENIDSTRYLVADWWRTKAEFQESIWLLKNDELPTLKNCPE